MASSHPGRTSPHTEEEVLHVLGLVLHHSKATDHSCLIFRLLPVSMSCKKLVEQSNVQCHVSLPPGNEQQYSRFSGFAAWLTRHRHAHLVGHLSIPYVNEHFVSVMEQLISSAMQLATAPTVLAAPGPGAAAAVARGCTAPAAVVQALPAAPLKLRSFEWDRPHSSVILQPLSSFHSLTSLKLTVEGKRLTPSMTAAIARLPGLEHLSVETPKGASRGALPLPWGDTFRALSVLTSLTLSTPSLMPDSLQELPVSLQGLSLTLRPCIKRYEAEAQRLLQLRHLQNLQGLVLRWEQVWCAEAVLPAQLPKLSLLGPVRAVLSSELQTAELRWCLGQGMMEQLQGLSRLTELTVHLHYHEWQNLAASVPLAALQETVSAVGAATQLRKLELHGRSVDLARDYGTQLQFGTALQQLRSLQTLQLEGLKLHETDAMMISCLTGLTDLSVSNGGRGLTSTVASAIACQLTGLQVLRLHACESLAGTAMPVIGSLSRLTLLDLSGNWFNLDDGCLEVLSGLSELQEFYIPHNRSASRDAWQEFESALKNLKCVRCSPSLCVDL